MSPKVVKAQLRQWGGALVWLCAMGVAWAQPSEGGVSPAEMAQRVKPCMACHGEQGRAGPDGYYPRLAGKPAGYLFHQLENFAQDRRHYPLMRKLIEPLSPAYRREMAQYFSSLSLPYPSPSQSEKDIDAALFERGRTLALEGDAGMGLPACVSCHGEKLMGHGPDVAAIVGLPVAYLNAQLSAWRDGQRQAQAPDCMAQVVKLMSLQDTAAVSAWLSTQTVGEHAWRVPALPSSPPWRCGSAPSVSSSQGAKQ